MKLRCKLVFRGSLAGLTPKEIVLENISPRCRVGDILCRIPPLAVQFLRDAQVPLQGKGEFS